MKNKNKKMAKKKSHAKAIGLAGVAGMAAAAAAGAYYLYGSKNAAKNRAKAKKWVKAAESKITPNMKATIVRELKTVKKAIKKIRK